MPPHTHTRNYTQSKLLPRPIQKVLFYDSLISSATYRLLFIFTGREQKFTPQGTQRIHQNITTSKYGE